MKLQNKNWNKYHGLTLLAAALVCYVVGFFGIMSGPDTSTSLYRSISVIIFFLSVVLAVVGVIAIVLALLAGTTQNATRAQHIFIAVVSVVAIYGLALYVHSQVRHRQADNCTQAVLRATANDNSSGFDYTQQSK